MQFRGLKKRVNEFPLGPSYESTNNINFGLLPSQKVNSCLLDHPSKVPGNTCCRLSAAASHELAI